MRAKDIMTTPAVVVSPAMHLKDVARLFVERDISAAPVVDEEGDLIGIVSEQDLLTMQAPDPRRHALVAGERLASPGAVSEVMKRHVISLPESADVATVARVMLEEKVKRIPIVSGLRVVGIVSRRDILKVLARSDEEIRQELQEFLSEEIEALGMYQAEVREGIVTLRGSRDERDRRLARLVAQSVAGVVAVDFADDD